MATERLLLEELVLLTKRVAAEKQQWVATAEDEELLRLAAAVTGRPLTPETFELAPSALTFLLAARFSVERRLWNQPTARIHSRFG